MGEGVLVEHPCGIQMSGYGILKFNDSQRLQFGNKEHTGSEDAYYGFPFALKHRRGMWKKETGVVGFIIKRD